MEWTVIDAVSGRVLLDKVTAAQFDAWYDSHSSYRKVREIEEIHPDLRARYGIGNAGEVFVTNA